MRFLLSQATGLVIDVQEKFVPHIAEYSEVLKRMQIVIKGLKTLGVPLAVTEQNASKLGATVPEIAQIIGSEASNKMEFSCYDHSPYRSWLEKQGWKTVIIVGIEAHVCVLQTAVDLKQAGYQPIIVWDAVSSRSLDNKKTALERFRQENIILASSESILFELMRTFEHPEAKTISGLLK